MYYWIFFSNFSTYVDILILKLSHVLFINFGSISMQDNFWLTFPFIKQSKRNYYQGQQKICLHFDKKNHKRNKISTINSN